MAWGLATILVGSVLMLAVPALFPELMPSEAFLACDRAGGDWDRVTRTCLPSDSRLSGAPM